MDAGHGSLSISKPIIATGDNRIERSKRFYSHVSHRQAATLREPHGHAFIERLAFQPEGAGFYDNV